MPLLPLVWLGYGTDIDVPGVRDSGYSLLHGDYRLSRSPGAFVHEAATGLLDRVGGSVAVNLGSWVAALVVVSFLARVLRRAGAPHAELAALALAASPHFVIAATSLADHLWALAFFVSGVDVFQRRRTTLAAALWAAALGCRLSTVVLVAAYLIAELLVGRRERRAVLSAAGITIVFGMLLFVPPWLSVGRSSAFLENTFGNPSITELVGRSVVKQELFFGLPALVLLLVAVPRIAAGLAHWRREPLVLCAVLGGVGVEAVFLRLPWKLSHLLPLLLCVVILAAFSSRIGSRWLLALAACQLAWGVLAVRIVLPDVPDRASSARFAPALVAGPLVSDVRCRIQHPAPGPAIADDVTDQAAVDAYSCAKSWAYGDSDEGVATGG